MSDFSSAITRRVLTSLLLLFASLSSFVVTINGEEAGKSRSSRNLRRGYDNDNRSMMPSEQGCCSLNFESCISWCGSTKGSCEACNNQDGVFWLPNGAPTTRCKKRWTECETDPDGCCDGLICEKNNDNYMMCRPSVADVVADAATDPVVANDNNTVIEGLVQFSDVVANDDDTVVEGPVQFSDVSDYRWGGGTCQWVAENPTERCVEPDPTSNYTKICMYCRKTCYDAGFVNVDTGNCHAKRSLQEIRFNKIPPLSQSDQWYLQNEDYVNGVNKKIFPMMPNDYPFHSNSDLVSTITTRTLADSVVVPGDYELNGSGPEDYYDSETQMTTTDFTEDKALFPGDDGYWDELEHVVDMQLARRDNVDPMSVNGWPDLWSNLTLKHIADAIRGEYPALHQSNCLESLWKSGEMDIRQEGRPFRSVVDFVGRQVRMGAINTWAFHAVAPVNFMLKWQVGMPRPEEVAWLISTGELTTEDDGVPRSIVRKIEKMELTQSHDFTAYDTGSPTHPSWPAMHSAGSTMSYWLPTVANLSAEQYCEALRVDYAVSYGRTIAGVHYQQDNIAGLNIGQRMIREQLPGYLSTEFGYDETIIQSRLDALAFDWKTFDSKSCTIDGVPAGEFLNNAIPPSLSDDNTIEFSK